MSLLDEDDKDNENLQFVDGKITNLTEICKSKDAISLLPTVSSQVLPPEDASHPSGLAAADVFGNNASFFEPVLSAAAPAVASRAPVSSVPSSLVAVESFLSSPLAVMPHVSVPEGAVGNSR